MAASGSKTGVGWDSGLGCTSDSVVQSEGLGLVGLRNSCQCLIRPSEISACLGCCGGSGVYPTGIMISWGCLAFAAFSAVFLFSQSLSSRSRC